MIVKFLYTKGPNSSFPAISYNTGKMDKNKGELMKVANLGALNALGQLRPEDYKNYLKMISAVNQSVTKPQLHVAISGEGKKYDKNELTEIAVQWMDRMGYAKQPYLIIYHKDTANNHAHIVSTRVTAGGKKIRDSYEQIRGHQQMNAVMGIDEKHNAEADLKKALSYQFATKAQFLMILESMGYRHREEGGSLLLFKFGRQQADLNVKLIDEQISRYQPDASRKAQLKAWFHKYALVHDTRLYRHHDKYTSAFALFMKDKLGVELMFHASADKPPYGFTVIDHSNKQLFKGGEIITLSELLAIPVNAQLARTHEEMTKADLAVAELDQDQLNYYAAILKAVINNYPDIIQGLCHHGLMVFRNGAELELHDPLNQIYIPLEDLLAEKEYQAVIEYFSQSDEINAEVYRQQHRFQGIVLATDIDDEAINGRNRRRKKQARTNTR